VVAMLSAIRDPLYGAVQLPTYLHGLFSCWEIQRLRYVRLINVNSLPLSVLGETSRYSHTLGAMCLGVRFLQEAGIDSEASVGKLLLATLALHDSGTPAFGHSLEYVLKQQGGGDHVQAAVSAINGLSPAGAYSWSGAPPRASHAKLRAELKRLLGASFEQQMIEALEGNGPVGGLVSSKSLDLDNIDNVFRMASALGLRDWPAEDPITIATGLVKMSPDAIIVRKGAVESIKRWAHVRRRVYEILNLNPLNLSGLAMLREAFETHCDAMGRFPSSAWWSTDGELLDILSPFASHITNRIKRGDLYPTLYTLWIDTSSDHLQRLEKLNNSLRLFSSLLENELDHRIRVHVVLDNGTFEREITLNVDNSSEVISFGKRSRSVIISVHSKSYSNSSPTRDKIERSVLSLLSDCFDVHPDLMWNSALVCDVHTGDTRRGLRLSQLPLFSTEPQLTNSPK
jgi:HD superfamily phosphohydrolase